MAAPQLVALARLAERALAGGPMAELHAEAVEAQKSGGEDPAFAAAVAAIVAAAESAEREREAERHRSLHDQLTGLPNRALAADRLERALARVGAGGAAAVAVFVVDIDDFSLMNDTHGHAIGDGVLIEAARRLTEAVGPSAGTVARLGADTFTVVYEAVVHQEIEAAAEAIHCCFDEPFSVNGAEVFASASLGIAVAPAGATPVAADALLQDADVALDAAKRTGRGQRERFREDLRVEALERLEMRNAMRRALEREEFKVWFQPEIGLESDRVVAFEALVRWEHPQLGVVSPASFLPLAEESGLIVPLGEWVIRAACAQLRTWRDSGIAASTDDGGLAIAVNLSTRQVAHPQLAVVVAGALADNELQPRSLWIEINESTLLTDVDGAHRGLERLHDLGVVIGVDDFGTGYSSLSYLQRFPVDFLKVDRSFVAGLGEGSGDDAIVGAVVAMARNLGLTAIAEGVETRQQRQALAQLGCDMAQGYLWCAALPATAATEWLTARLAEEAGLADGPPLRPASLRGRRRGRKPGAGRARGDLDAAVGVGNDTTRAFLRISSGEEAVGLLISAVGRLGGQVMPARLRDPHGVPLDLSLGLGEPIQPVAALGTPAREHLERVMPALLDDARLAIERLPAADSRGDGEADPVTGLLTRRAAGRALGRLAAGSAVALLDLDGVAAHRERDPAAADAVLRSLSRLLRERLGVADKAGRFADDQLLLLLPGRTPDDVVELLERVRRMWRRVRPEPLTLTAAVGVVGERGPQFSLVAVDQALTAARDAGGDRIASAVP